jgi:hypothetical protein
MDRGKYPSVCLGLWSLLFRWGFPRCRTCPVQHILNLYLLAPCGKTRDKWAALSPPWMNEEYETLAQEHVAVLMLYLKVPPYILFFLICLAGRYYRPNLHWQRTAVPPECTSILPLSR